MLDFFARHTLHQSRLLQLAATFLLAGLILNACAPRSQPVVPEPEPDWNQYSAKFVCGTVPPTTSDRALLNVGRYFTSVNLHNPDLQDEAELWFKAVVSAEPPVTNSPSPYKRQSLPADTAIVIDCAEIRRLVGALGQSQLIEGWVVVVSPDELDVSPVYTAGAGATTYPVRSIDVELIASRPIFAPALELLGEEPREAARCPGGEGCCCNILNRSTGQLWPSCSPSLECRSWNISPPSGPVATCTPIGRSPAFVSQLHSSQPPFCGNP